MLKSECVGYSFFDGSVSVFVKSIIKKRRVFVKISS
jgi:hypothetical protein